MVINKKIKVEVKSKNEKSEGGLKKKCHLFSHFTGELLSQMQEFRKYLSYLSERYGVSLRCLDSWKEEFQDTVWLLLTGMLLEKLESPNECLCGSPLMVMEEKDSSLSGTEVSNGTNGTDTDRDMSVIHSYDRLKINRVSSVYRYSRSKYNIPGKSVPKVNFSGLWLKDYGFETGKKYEVYGFKNHLVLKIADCMVKDSSITIGRINS